MRKTDRQLGMDRAITRRDLLQGATLAALGLPLGAGMKAFAAADNMPGAAAPYPPTLTGLRGSHPGSFEAAHALRDGASFGAPVDTGERYDAIVVGAGISGLAAAHYYRKRFGDDARVLILENHDDFGGHARRNEFHQGGQMRLSLGGTHNLEHWKFSRTVKRLMKELGINSRELLKHKEFGYGENGAKGSAIWFDEETYGENRLVTGINPMDSVPPIEKIDEYPISAAAKRQLKHLYLTRKDVLAHMDEDEKWDYLAGVRYTDFLREHGISDEVLQLYANSLHGSWGVHLDAISASEAFQDGMPGMGMVGITPDPDAKWNYPVAMYPDGNASVARLLVHRLIPAVAPGTTADNIAVAQFDYAQLDKADAPVRLRLNSTVVRAANVAGGTEVCYLNGGKVLRVQATHCVLACYHVIIPHLCPEMPAAQKAAQTRQVKRPLVLNNALIRSSRPMDALGITGARCPGRMFGKVFMYKGLNVGGFEHRMADDGPVPLVLWGAIAPPPGDLTLFEQLRASRHKMLAMSFEDYEREVRRVLDGLLGPAGFDVKRDLLALTVNRWPHGYSHDYMDLWDDDYAPGEAPHEIASQPFGAITIANSDAGADAYTHVAIDEAFRAVRELA